jgi:hypothetical protein
MTNAIIRYDPSSYLAGYGFDLAADRVVRFNKRADGTYLNTRATYSINTRQYTHFEMRAEALKMQAVTHGLNPPFKIPRWVFTAVIMLLVLLSFAECSVNVNVDDATSEVSEKAP